MAAPASSSSSSAAFERAHKQQRQELEASFVRLLKELKFKQALRTARTILELEPGNARIKEFIPLLEEKVALDEDDGDDEEEEDGEAGHAAGDDDEGGDSDDDTDDEDEEEDEEDEDDEDDDDEEDEPTTSSAGGKQQDMLIGAHPPSAARRRWLTTDSSDAAQDPPAQEAQGSHPIDSISAGVTRLALDTSNSHLSAEQRRRIRQDLARSVAELKAAQTALADDPLLGA